MIWIQIAMKELRQRKIPFTIRRYLPDGRWEIALSLYYSLHSLDLFFSCDLLMIPETVSRNGELMNWSWKTHGNVKLVVIDNLTRDKSTNTYVTCKLFLSYGW